MKKIIFPLLAVVAFASCKKSDVKKQNCVVNQTTIAGDYKVESIKYKISSTTPELDLFSSLDPCEKDDLYQLQADGSMQKSDVGITCGGMMPPSPANSWALVSDNTRIQLTDGEYLIESFDCNRLVLSMTDISALGDKQTMVLIRQ